MPFNYLCHAALPRENWDNDIAVLSNLRGRPKLERLYQPGRGRILRDVRLDFDGERLLFSSIDDHKRWAVFQVRKDGGGVEQVTPTNYPDVDFFDACPLPSGKIVLCSTASYIGLPCLDGSQQVASLYLLDPASKALRQLTFDQDSDNDPAVLNDGRILYQRWEYSDIPHYFSRRRMSMNPDGTGQLALHGSGSWFPTAFRFARPVPDHPTLLAGIISGHHDFGDCGRLALLDPALAGAYPFRHRPASKEWGVEGQPIAVTPEILPAEQTGFVQLIPGWGKPVPGTVCDAIVGDVYRKERPSLTTHPHPLSSKYFLVSMKPDAQSLWGIYLVDVFDNATLIAELEGAALFEPQPLTARPRPPVIPDRIAPEKRTADVHIADIYSGPALQGVPRGTVKKVRVFSYHFGYVNKAGFPHIGTEAGWDVKRILGTATVEADGSACFQIPANTPVSLQPLDSEGRALQLMRSWLVGMPGERVSCVGCHERRAATLPPKAGLADARGSEPLQPWFGPPRPFAFTHEVFPVLEQYCVGCHSDTATVGPRSKPCFRDPNTAYDTIHPYVHRPGVESDMAVLTPLDYHASTSLLIQMLEKGHHGVKLAEMSREARERLYCWIDLNVPRAGNWNPPNWQNCDQRQRRRELAMAFANDATDPEAEFLAAQKAFQKRTPARVVASAVAEAVPPDGLGAQGFPMPAAAARQRQAANPGDARRVLDLGGGLKMNFVWVPAGEFVMGSLAGAPDERPRARVRIAQPFWIAEAEVNNAQYARFDPAHDTRYVDMHYMDQTVPGHIANHADQPVARVSWAEAMRFCQWLNRQAGVTASLPTEAQWEWAARAGTETQFFYGSLDTDFGRFANLADQSLRWYRMSYDGPSALPRRYPYPPEMNFPLHDERFRDRWHVVDYVGQTEPNAWGLKDMVGNVSEWTRSSYRPYPFAEDGRDDENPRERKVARGGSWADRPADAGASVRRAFEPWQKVHDVGFRVILAANEPSAAPAAPPAAALKLTAPLDYQVVQRKSEATGTLKIAGAVSAAGAVVTAVEARLHAGKNPEWRRLPATFDGATFSAEMEAPAGGWYHLEVRVWSGDRVLAESAVDHVGVGEIFVVAGQSNSANHGEEKQQTKTGRVATFDGQRWQLGNDPQPGASGAGGSFLPPFGDAFAQQFKVPVGFIACGIGATSVREWLPRGTPFPNPPTIESRVAKRPDGEWESKGEAFEMFTARLKSLGPRGFRALLWHQGESDANQKDPTRTLPGKLYREYLEKVIRDSRRGIGWEAPWFVAQVSYHVPGDEASPDIRAAQAALWKDGLALEGPDSDALKGRLREAGGTGVHFSGEGLRQHAARWVEKVAPWLEQQAKGNGS